MLPTRKFGRTEILVLFCVLFFPNCTGGEQKTTQRNTPRERKAIEQNTPTWGNIPIKVAIIYHFGGPQAVASEDFYLLTKDAGEVWKQTGLLKEG